MLLVVWSVPGLLSALQLWLLTMQRPRPIAEYLVQIPPWWVWVAATPLIGRLAEWRPVVGRAWYRNVGWHLGACALLTVVQGSAFLAVNRLSDPSFLADYSLLVALRIAAFKMIFIVALAYAALVAVQHLLGLHRARARLEVELARAQLDALRAQIRPHFLFNTLNTIAMQVRTGAPAAAVEMLSQLGALLRETVDSDAPEVALERELGFVRRLLEIEQVRLGERLRVSWSVAPGVGRARVPAFLLQPLVENALRHGIGSTTRGGEVRVEARRDGGRLVVEVLDDGVGLTGPVEARVGLGNVRARLERLYPGAHSLEVAARKGGGVRAAVAIPFEEMADG
jgi:two-component system, LytTR family, sensor kinase